MHYQWQWNHGKKQKLSHLNKILNDIECNLNWSNFNWIDFQFHWISIQQLDLIVKKNGMQIVGKVIENFLLNMMLAKKIKLKT
jgi:hypothetical protein